MWKIDTEKQGLDAIFKPYQYATIKYVLDHEQVTSGETHATLNHRGIEISRASVINYLQKLTKFGIINQAKQSGKGGYHGVYSAKLSFKEIVQRITEDALDAVNRAFPESDHLKYLTQE